MFSHPATRFICRRCGEDAGLDPEICWYCQGPLCSDCWERYGHCGHPEAEAMNEQARQVNQDGES
jgi:hypothetical protein